MEQGRSAVGIPDQSKVDVSDDSGGEAGSGQSRRRLRRVPWTLAVALSVDIGLLFTRMQKHRTALAICIAAASCVGMLAGDHVFLLWGRYPYGWKWGAMMGFAIGPFIFILVCLSTLYGVWILERGGYWRKTACFLLGVSAFGAFLWIGFAWVANHGS